MKYYKIKYSDKFRGLLTIDRSEWSTFINLYREKEYALALQKFPKNWHWVGSDVANQKISDMPIGHGGVILSERAFLIFKDFLKLEHHAELMVDQHKYYWFAVQDSIEESNLERCIFDVLSIKPSYEKLFSEEFVNLWLDNGFTGVEFQLYVN